MFSSSAAAGIPIAFATIGGSSVVVESRARAVYQRWDQYTVLRQGAVSDLAVLSPC